MGGAAPVRSARRDLSLFLNDCRAVEHLTRVISSMRGQRAEAVACICCRNMQSSQLSDDHFLLNGEKKENKNAISTVLSAFVADLAASELHGSLGDLEQLYQEGKRGGGGMVVARFYDSLYGRVRLLSKHLPTAHQLGQPIVDVSSHADLPPSLLTAAGAKTNTLPLSAGIHI